MTNFDLHTYLTAGAQWVENALDSLLPPSNVRPSVLNQAIRYSLLGDGKRLRPILCAAMAEACGATREVARYPAAAIECLHTYTLIHDDLPAMDNDDLRRGRPTCHKKFPEAIAILAGDALQAYAFEILSKTSSLPLWQELSAAALGVIHGQTEDIQAETASPSPENAPEVLDYIHHHKTGDLIRCSCRMGVLAANGSPACLEAATTYSQSIGWAFQIADDLLNVTSTPEMLGKAVGTDAARGKLTYVSLHGEKAAREKMNSLLDAALATLSAFLGDIRPLAALAQHTITREK